MPIRAVTRTPWGSARAVLFVSAACRAGARTRRAARGSARGVAFRECSGAGAPLGEATCRSNRHVTTTRHAAARPAADPGSCSGATGRAARPPPVRAGQVAGSSRYMARIGRSSLCRTDPRLGLPAPARRSHSGGHRVAPHGLSSPPAGPGHRPQGGNARVARTSPSSVRIAAPCHRPQGGNARVARTAHHTRPAIRPCRSPQFPS